MVASTGHYGPFSIAHILGEGSSSEEDPTRPAGHKRVTSKATRGVRPHFDDEQIESNDLVTQESSIPTVPSKRKFDLRVSSFQMAQV